MSKDIKIELKYIKIFYYRKRELKEKFYINNLTTTCREFYQVLYRFNDLTRVTEYAKCENGTVFKETYIRR